MLVLSKYCVKWKWKPCCVHASLLLSSFVLERWLMFLSVGGTRGVPQHRKGSLCTVATARGSLTDSMFLLFHFVPSLNFYPICDSSNNAQWETK